MQCRYVMVIFCLVIVFPNQVYSMTCLFCNDDTHQEAKPVCSRMGRFSGKCMHDDSFCAVFKGNDGTVTQRRCIAKHHGDYPKEMFEMGKFCDRRSNDLVLCACGQENCNDDSCKCEDASAAELENSEIKELEPQESGSEETTTRKATKPRRKTKSTKATKSIKLPKSTTQTKAPTENTTQTEKPKNTTQTEEPQSVSSGTRQTKSAEDKEKLGENNCNIVLVAWQNVFFFTCISVFQFFY